ncbi:hypothetical protein FLA_2389 [Filimonas lacunae]|nr:hypothetical protein FLA_2389 [Filimonas lacunae]
MEQLRVMGLKAYDLIWVEGKSAAWRYPGELPEMADFAPAVEEQPYDRFYRKTAKPGKPRFRIKADWRKIDENITPAIEKAVTPTAILLQEMPVIPQEKTAIPSMAPITPHQPTVPLVVSQIVGNSELQDEKMVPQTKYSESLDIIKERYSQTVLGRKHSGLKASFARYALLVGLFPVLAAGIWIGSSWNNQHKLETINTTEPVKERVSTPAAEPAVLQPSVNEPAPTQPEAVPEMRTVANTIPATQNRVTTVTPPFTVNTGKRVATTVAAVTKKTVLTAAVATLPANKGKWTKPVQNVTGAPVTQAVYHNSTPVTKTTDGPATVSVSQNYAPVTVASKNKITDYVSVRDEVEQMDNNNKQVRLHVNNKSNIPVDLVVLDLQYYDSNGKFKKGETLYVNNLSAQDEVVLNAPMAKNGQRVDYKVALLSIEKKGVYLIAE